MEEQRIWNLMAKRLAGEASAEDLLELENLMRRYPDLHYPMQTVADLWNLELQQDPDEISQAFARHRERMHAQGIDLEAETPPRPAFGRSSQANQLLARRKNTHRLLFLFSTGILLVLLWVFGSEKIVHTVQPLPPAADKSRSEISTRNGSKTNLVLPDGSQVWLNAGSTLSYDRNFGAGLREVTLSGEAFFDVAHNAEKPFIIHTTKMDIKVLGTKFNVKTYPSDRTSEASLIRGSIEVMLHDRPNQKIVLKPNEKIVVANDPAGLSATRTMRGGAALSSQPLVTIRNLTREPVSGVIAETSWVENKLIFQDQSFRDLAQDMQRWYAVSIRFDDPQLDTLHFTGIFENETVQQALDALKLTKAASDFNYTMQGSTITITK
jgi:ferric-dicitrate binding protein FerR (iron transport regulator)